MSEDGEDDYEHVKYKDKKHRMGSREPAGSSDGADCCHGSGGDLYDLHGLFFLFLDFTGFGKAFTLVILTGNKRCRCKQTWRGRH